MNSPPITHGEPKIVAVRLALVPRGRPLKSVDASASCAARFGAELRGTRVAQNLTLAALASRIGYTLQHISEVELAKAGVSKAFVEACDEALDAGGRLLALYPAVRVEQIVGTRSVSGVWGGDQAAAWSAAGGGIGVGWSVRRAVWTLVCV